MEVREAALGVYGPHGALSFFDPPLDYRRMFSATGVDLLGYDRPTVLRARDGAGASGLLTFSISNYLKSGYAEISGVPGLPGHTACAKRSAAPTSNRTFAVW